MNDPVAYESGTLRLLTPILPLAPTSLLPRLSLGTGSRSGMGKARVAIGGGPLAGDCLSFRTRRGAIVAGGAVSVRDIAGSGGGLAVRAGHRSLTAGLTITIRCGALAFESLATWAGNTSLPGGLAVSIGRGCLPGRGPATRAGQSARSACGARTHGCCAGGGSAPPTSAGAAFRRWFRRLSLYRLRTSQRQRCTAKRGHRGSGTKFAKYLHCLIVLRGQCHFN